MTIELLVFVLSRLPSQPTKSTTQPTTSTTTDDANAHFCTHMTTASADELVKLLIGFDRPLIKPVMKTPDGFAASDVALAFGGKMCCL